MTLRRTAILLLFTVVGFGFIWLAEPFSQWLNKYLLTPPEKPAITKQAIGIIEAVEGSAWLKKKNENSKKLLEGTGLRQAIHLHDELVTKENTRVFITLKKSSFFIEENSQAFFELADSESQASSLYVTLLKGQWSLETLGEPDSFFFIINGVKSQKPTFHSVNEHELRIQPISPSTTFINSAVSLIPKPQTDDLSATNPDELKKGNEQITLTNKYIDRVIKKKRRSFQNCQTNALRQHKEVNGRILLEIVIETSGSVSSVKVQSSNLDNKEFTKCLTEIFRRTKFRAFQGSPIIKTYPIVFE